MVFQIFPRQIFDCHKFREQLCEFRILFRQFATVVNLLWNRALHLAQAYRNPGQKCEHLVYWLLYSYMVRKTQKAHIKQDRDSDPTSEEQRPKKKSFRVLRWRVSNALFRGVWRPRRAFAKFWRISRKITNMDRSVGRVFHSERGWLCHISHNSKIE